MLSLQPWVTGTRVVEYCSSESLVYKAEMKHVEEFIEVAEQLVRQAQVATFNLGGNWFLMADFELFLVDPMLLQLAGRPVHLENMY